MFRLPVLCSLVLLMVPATGMAAYSQNFDALNPGPVNGQSGWQGPPSSVVQSGVAKSGRALQLDFNAGQTTRRSGVFDSAALSPLARLEFDLYLPVTASNIAGQANRSMEATLRWTGPSDAVLPFVIFQYRGQTDSFGNVHFNFFGINNESPKSGPVSAQVWYHVTADMDWIAGTTDLRIANPDGSTFYDPSATSNFNSGIGGVNSMVLQSDLANDDLPRLYFDNLAITAIPEPAWAGVLILVAAWTFISPRRRRL